MGGDMPGRGRGIMDRGILVRGIGAVLDEFGAFRIRHIQLPWAGHPVAGGIRGGQGIGKPPHAVCLQQFFLVPAGAVFVHLGAGPPGAGRERIPVVCGSVVVLGRVDRERP